MPTPLLRRRLGIFFFLVDKYVQYTSTVHEKPSCIGCIQYNIIIILCSRLPVSVRVCSVYTHLAFQRVPFKSTFARARWVCAGYNIIYHNNSRAESGDEKKNIHITYYI